MIPDATMMESVPWPHLAGMAADGERLAVGFATSTLCGNLTYAGVEIPGMANFAAKLMDIPGVVSSGTLHQCIEQVSCVGVGDAQQQVACAAGKAFLDLKLQLLEGDLQTGGEERMF